MKLIILDGELHKYNVCTIQYTFVHHIINRKIFIIQFKIFFIKINRLLTNDFPIYFDGIQKISLLFRITLELPRSIRVTFAETVSIISNISPRYLNKKSFSMKNI